jgi:hypothetical protein
MTSSIPTFEHIAGDLATLHAQMVGHLVEGTTPTREELLELVEDLEETQADMEKAMANLDAFLVAAGETLRSPRPVPFQPKAEA